MRVVTAIVLLLLLSSCSFRQSTEPILPTGSPKQQCLLAAQRKARAAMQQEVSRDAVRLELEIDSAICVNPTMPRATAYVIGAIAADRARHAEDFLAGRINLAAFKRLLGDRSRKRSQLLSDPAAQYALIDGDQDRDLVPDSRDDCPETPDGVVTDDRGCPSRLGREMDEQEDERSLRAVLDRAVVPFNSSCDGAERPATPQPLEWGRGEQTKLGSSGFNIAVTKVAGQPAGCEIYYEIQLRFIDPVNSILPKAMDIGVVFRDSEDLLSEPSRAVFGLPMPMDIPLSPARTAARKAFATQYMTLMWRVRAVNGSSMSSNWSPLVIQQPASAGVQANIADIYRSSREAAS